MPKPPGPNTAGRYANDPRVEPHAAGDGYTVTVKGDREKYHIVYIHGVNWALCYGPTMTFVHLPEGGATTAHFALGYEDPGEMIQALIGDPQR